MSAWTAGGWVGGQEGMSLFYVSHALCELCYICESVCPRSLILHICAVILCALSSRAALAWESFTWVPVRLLLFLTWSSFHAGSYRPSCISHVASDIDASSQSSERTYHRDEQGSTRQSVRRKMWSDSNEISLVSSTCVSIPDPLTTNHAEHLDRSLRRV